MSETSTIPPTESSSIDPKLLKLLAEYLHSEKAENGWRQHFKDTLEDIRRKIEEGHTATRDIADKVIELTTELDAHIRDEKHNIDSIRGYLAKHTEWKAAVDNRLADLGDWEEITGQHVMEELKQKRESDRARSKNRSKMLWWALGIIGVLATNAGTAFISQCASTPKHGSSQR